MEKRDRVSGIEQQFDPEAGPARGVLSHSPLAGKMTHARRSPSPDLAPWIAHYWVVRWDLRGCEPYRAETLPHPNIHLLIEHDRMVLSGVHTAKFSRLLEGQSSAFGVKFRIAAFRPFVDYPVSRLANCTVEVTSLCGRLLPPLQTVCAEEEKILAVEAFFRAGLPGADENMEQASQLVEQILAEPGIRTVHDLAKQSGMSVRSLQRLFSEYVGASPKWVIRRYRLHEVVEKIHSGNVFKWPQLALDLGYFDQAHLINDFQRVVGYSPVEYQKLNAKNP